MALFQRKDNFIEKTILIKNKKVNIISIWSIEREVEIAIVKIYDTPSGNINIMFDDLYHLIVYGDYILPKKYIKQYISLIFLYL